MEKYEPDELLQRLGDLKCRIESQDTGDFVVHLPDDSTSFLFERIGGWIHLCSTLIPANILEKSIYAIKLERFLLEIQHRCLGCHFSFDDDGYLAIGADVYPNQQNPEDIFFIMRQTDYVGNVILPLCEKILRTGILPSDMEIDEAFDEEER